MRLLPRVGGGGSMPSRPSSTSTKDSCPKAERVSATAERTETARPRSEERKIARGTIGSSASFFVSTARKWRNWQTR
jgi:hypothetical protein